jgi:hypothetical protein
MSTRLLLAVSQDEKLSAKRSGFRFSTALQVRMRREPIPVAKALIGASPSLAGSRRSMARGVKVTGGQIDKAGLLQIGESGF